MDHFKTLNPALEFSNIMPHHDSMDDTLSLELFPEERKTEKSFLDKTVSFVETAVEKGTKLYKFGQKAMNVIGTIASVLPLAASGLEY